jgi:hypothetical protein
MSLISLHLFFLSSQSLFRLFVQVFLVFFNISSHFSGSFIVWLSLWWFLRYSQDSRVTEPVGLKWFWECGATFRRQVLRRKNNRSCIKKPLGGVVTPYHSIFNLESFEGGNLWVGEGSEYNIRCLLVSQLLVKTKWSVGFLGKGCKVFLILTPF